MEKCRRGSPGAIGPILRIKSVDDVKGNSVRIISEVQMEREGEERPVMVAWTIGLAYA